MKPCWAGAMKKCSCLVLASAAKNGSLRVRWAEHIADSTVVPPTRYDSNSYAHAQTKALSSEEQIQPKVVRQKLGGPVAYLGPAQNSTALRFSLRPYSDSIPVFRSMPPADSMNSTRRVRKQVPVSENLKVIYIYIYMSTRRVRKQVNLKLAEYWRVYIYTYIYVYIYIYTVQGWVALFSAAAACANFRISPFPFKNRKSIHAQRNRQVIRRGGQHRRLVSLYLLAPHWLPRFAAMAPPAEKVPSAASAAASAAAASSPTSATPFLSATLRHAKAFSI